MARIKGFNYPPEPRGSEGLLLIKSQGTDRRYASKWPRKRPHAKSAAAIYQILEFAAAVEGIKRAEDISRQTAAEWSKGTNYTWRDWLLACWYGTAYKITDADGNEYVSVRTVDPNPQRILDLITDQVGSIIWRSPIGWIALAPGADAEILTLYGAQPIWKRGADILDVARKDAPFVTFDVPGTLTNARRAVSGTSVLVDTATAAQIKFRRAALTGAVTAAEDSNATQIAARAVGSAELAAIANARVLGRKSAGSGDAEQLTLSDVLDLVGGATGGDVLARSGTGWARVPAGTAGDFLKSNGAGNLPSYGAAGGSGGGGGLVQPDYRDTTVYLVPPSVASSPLSSFTVVLGTIYFVPISNPALRTMTSIGISVNSGGNIAGSNCRLAIYNVASDGGPGTVKVDAGNVSTAAAGFVAATISTPLAAGNYYLALWCSHAVTLRACHTASTLSWGSWNLGSASPTAIIGSTRAAAFGGAYGDETAQAHNLRTAGSAVPLIGIR